MQEKPLLFWSGLALALHLALLTWGPPGIAPKGGTAPVTVSLRPAAAPPVSPPGAVKPPAPQKPPPPAPSRPESLFRPSPAAQPKPLAAPPTSASQTPPPATHQIYEPEPSPLSSPAEVNIAFAEETGPASAEAEMSLVEAHPRYDVNPPPVYPRLAERRGWEGEVRLLVRVAASGVVQEAGIEASSGYPILDRAAREAVLNWRFEPGRRGGVAVESQVVVPVTFRLRRS